MISFVTWKWHTPQSPRMFKSKHVNVLFSMIARWYQQPFRFICITDDAAGLDARIEAMPMPVTLDNLSSPQGPRFPNCYCRLWNFSREAVILGERILQLDIDVIITGDLAPIVERQEDFVGWCDPRFKNNDGKMQNKIAGGAYLLKTGSMPHIWEDFDPQRSPAEAFAAGNLGSDQGWMSYKLYPPPGHWKKGLVKLNWTPQGQRQPPQGARMVFTNGVKPPWDLGVQKKWPWIKDFWKL